ncbi:MAG: hypothetical protein WBO70_00945 [Erysipelotrichaceae bacterium]
MDKLFKYSYLIKQLQLYHQTYSLKQHLIIVLLSVCSVSILSYILHLQIFNILGINLLVLLMLPISIRWYYYGLYQKMLFNNWITYLNMFVGLYQINPKCYQVLKDCLPLCNYELKEQVSLAIKDLDEGKDLFESLMHINLIFNHFVINNLHNYVYMIEKYGIKDYQAGMINILNDLDQLSDDINSYKQKQQQMKVRIWILCGLSIVIAIMLNIIFSTIDISINSDIYQISMSVYVLGLVGVVLGSNRIYKKPFIDNGECL